MRNPGGTRAVETASDGTEGLSADGLGPSRLNDIQRLRLLNAMTEVCAEHGVSKVTVAQVVARSGVSRRTFYEIFNDREACFYATAKDGIATAARYVMPAYKAQTRWHLRIRAGIAGLLEFLEDEPLMGRLLIVDTLGAGPRVLELRSWVTEQMIALVDEGRAEMKSGHGPPPLTAEGLVGGALSVLHARLLKRNGPPLVQMTGQLTSMIVLPYLGQAVARRELARSVAPRAAVWHPAPTNPLRDIEMRLTYRTMCVLTAVAEHPSSSNREIGLAAGMEDQGQISKLLTRLRRLGLIENTGSRPAKGAPNAWELTSKGRDVQKVVRPRPAQHISEAMQAPVAELSCGSKNAQV